MADTADDEAAPDRLASLVIPVFNEAENIVSLLDGLQQSVTQPHETLLIYDFDEDTTLPPARRRAKTYPEVRLIRNDLGAGVLNALKSGIAAASGDAVIVTMADLSDDVTQIDAMAEMVRSGSSVVAGSRYMKGGGQVGGPAAKSFLSRMAGLSLHWLSGIQTHDATNNFKAYSRSFLDQVTIESSSGFELGLELATKAHLSGLQISEIPTVWHDRTEGVSNFKVVQWLPSYLRWYFKCVIGSWTTRRRRR